MARVLAKLAPLPLADDRGARVVLDDGMALFGPTDPDIFVERPALRDALNAAWNDSGGHGPVTDGELALLHDVVLRYHNELSPPRLYGYRTRNLRPGDMFVDVGAFRGYVSAKASRIVGSGGQVLCLEAIDENLMFCDMHVAENGLSNVTVVGAALSTEPLSEINFFQTKNHENAQVATHLGSESRRVSVPNLPVADLVEEVGQSPCQRVFMSITTNGTELAIVDELLSLIERMHKSHVELTIPCIYNLRAVRAKFRAWSGRGLSFSVNYPWATVRWS